MAAMSAIRARWAQMPPPIEWRMCLRGIAIGMLIAFSLLAGDGSIGDRMGRGASLYQDARHQEGRRPVLGMGQVPSLTGCRPARGSARVARSLDSLDSPIPAAFPPWPRPGPAG